MNSLIEAHITNETTTMGRQAGGAVEIMLRALIVDDHLLIRFGVTQMLQTEFGHGVIVGAAENADQAIQMIRESAWDVVIMDITLPGRSGLSALEEIKVLRPKLPVLILSAHAEEEFAVRVLKAGAAGFIPKLSTHTETIAAIKTVLAGGKHITNITAQMLVEHVVSPGDKVPHNDLSDRELQVLTMLGEGKTPTEIANALSLSIKTVSTYRARILEKMNMKTSAQLIRYAIEHHLVEK